jgi:hypothetical protein
MLMSMTGMTEFATVRGIFSNDTIPMVHITLIITFSRGRNAPRKLLKLMSKIKKIIKSAIGMSFDKFLMAIVSTALLTGEIP